jgi:hypothetical protein
MSVHILRTPMEEIVRRPDGERWCFTCRERRDFEYVVEAPVIDPAIPLDEQTGAYYGPTPHIECSVCKTWDGDCFPGTNREWGDE